MVCIIRSLIVECRVATVQDVSETMQYAWLDVVTGGPFRFEAGQRVTLMREDQGPRDVGIASRPDEALLEVHFSYRGDGGDPAVASPRLRAGHTVWVQGPYGDAALRRYHGGPVLVIATAAGLAAAKSIVETVLATSGDDPVVLVCYLSNGKTCYLREHLATLQSRFCRLRVVYVLDPTVSSQGLPVPQMLALGMAEGSSLPWRAYLIGSPPMIDAVSAALVCLGVDASSIHADALPVQDRDHLMVAGIA